MGWNKEAEEQRLRGARWKAVAKSLRCAFENGYARVRGSREIGHLWSAHENIRRLMDDAQAQRERADRLEAALAEANKRVPYTGAT